MTKHQKKVFTEIVKIFEASEVSAKLSVACGAFGDTDIAESHRAFFLSGIEGLPYVKDANILFDQLKKAHR